MALMDEQRRMVRFLHYEKALALMPGLSEGLLATLNGLTLEDYRATRAQFAAEAREAARDLLADATFAASADRLPFAPGAVVVGLGDSITDDLQSWLEILRHLLDLRRPADAIQVVNAGISGETTAQMYSRFLGAVAARQPSWIICMAGTNDARTHGTSPIKTLVSADETERNLAALRNFAATQTSARWLWLTPAAVIEEQIAADPFLSMLQAMWRNDDLAVVAAAVRRQPDPHVDLQTLFGLPADPALFISDGLHPSLAGQKVIVRAVVEHLSGA
jgi:acyl-CoA thioesterase-1